MIDLSRVGIGDCAKDLQVNKIYCEDNLETMARMPDDFIDVTVTSPPYNKRGVSGKIVNKVMYDSYDDKIDEEDYQKLQIKIMDELYRVSKVLFYNHKVRYEGCAIHPMEWILKTKWKLHQEIIWNRKLTGNIRGWRCWSTDERIYWLVKDKPSEIPQEYAQYTTVWDIRPEMKRIGHPAPFPEEIAKRCIQIGSLNGGLVYDPFMGSGTTAKMALETGRTFIGSEISQEYCKIANNRIHEVETNKCNSIARVNPIKYANWFCDD